MDPFAMLEGEPVLLPVDTNFPLEGEETTQLSHTCRPGSWQAWAQQSHLDSPQ